ncbi:hypothetical protein KR093_000170 [Drosophila rubida]|uniref:Uncharacterized protein n=1 Tax=Drosophila rubida TaxID=30044 RepID=A0AAD4PQU4_9MUSC|nr:hypothetical protein KR093_000170 [Drosophila rubida]
MFKFFNKHILEELEDSFDRWIKNPPRQFNTSPDGGIYFVFVAQQLADKRDDSVYKEAVGRIINEPLKEFKIRRRWDRKPKTHPTTSALLALSTPQAAGTSVILEPDDWQQGAAAIASGTSMLTSSSSGSRYVNPLDSNFLITRSEFFAICAETCVTAKMDLRANSPVMSSLLIKWEIFCDLLKQMCDRFGLDQATALLAALFDKPLAFIGRPT